MFASFVIALRDAGIPVSLTEYLSLLGAMRAGVAAYDVEDFYFLSRAALIKDERHLDRFDRVFSQIFKGLESNTAAEPGLAQRELPAEWLRRLAESTSPRKKKPKLKP